jgi:hypothetical protein
MQEENAFKLHSDIVKNEHLRRALLVDNIRMLHEVFDKKYYKDILGNKEGQWAGYLADLEIFYSRNEVYKYIKIYKYLTQKLNVEPSKWLEIPLTRLSQCLSHLTQDNYEEWFTKANVLTPKDWKIETRKAKGFITEDDEHEHIMEQFEVCKVCGAKHRV